MANYRWRTTFNYQNNPGANYHLSYGATPNTYDSWQTAIAGGTGSNTTTYYYRDSNTMYSGGWYDTISSKVDVNVTQTWTSSVDNLNNLTISVTTVINSVVRNDCRGNDQNTPGRNINIYKEQGGSAYISVTDNQVATNHSISGSVNMGTYTFTLAPGQNLTKNTLYIHNQTVGSTSYDDIWAGVQFQNPLPTPTTYRLTYDANGGSGAPAAQTTTTADSSVTFTVSSTAPTWGYYRFLGWSRVRHEESCTDADVEYRAGDTITLQESSPTLTLYAVWMKDYRPGTSLDTNTSVWKSHNRTNGACHVRTNSGWQECRTIGGEAGAKGNPPLILTANDADSWRNQKLLGKG